MRTSTVTIQDQTTSRNGILIYGIGAALALSAISCLPAQRIQAISPRSQFQPLEASRSPRLRRDRLKAAAKSPHTNQVSDLVQALGISRSGIASMLGVSRQALYLWGQGGHKREKNAERLTALSDAARVLLAERNPLPALWQHRNLPDFGCSFSQGMRNSEDPVAMAEQLAQMWRVETSEAATLGGLFEDRS